MKSVFFPLDTLGDFMFVHLPARDAHRRPHPGPDGDADGNTVSITATDLDFSQA